MDRKKSPFRGTGVALITPFAASGAIQFEALTRLINHCIQGGVDYLVVLGTTGESTTLSKEEKEQVKKHIVAVNKGRLPLVLGVGGNDTQQIKAQIIEEDVTGYEAILSVSPSYIRPTQAGIYAHFKALAAVSPLPIILYNVPARTGSNMLPATVITLAKECDQIIGIKEACGNVVQVMELLKDRPDDFLVISGDDLTALPSVTAGADGVISVLGQGVPEHFSTMIRKGLDGALAEAYHGQFSLMPLMDLIFREGNPTGIKALLSLKNICEPQVRLPLVEATEGLKTAIKNELELL